MSVYSRIITIYSSDSNNLELYKADFTTQKKQPIFSHLMQTNKQLFHINMIFTMPKLAVRIIHEYLFLSQFLSLRVHAEQYLPPDHSACRQYQHIHDQYDKYC